MIEYLLKFCLVGGSGVFVDFGITYFFKERVKWNKYFANALGFFSASTTNYILNRIWTFNSSNPAIEREYSTFLIIAIIGLIINTIVLYFFSDLFKPRIFPNNQKNRFYLAKLFATGIVTLWNFFMNYYITFAL